MQPYTFWNNDEVALVIHVFTQWIDRLPPIFEVSVTAISLPKEDTGVANGTWTLGIFINDFVEAQFLNFALLGQYFEENVVITNELFPRVEPSSSDKVEIVV